VARFLRGHPLDLAVFRVVVFIVVLGSPDLHGAWKWAGLPEAARLSPLGWDWVVRAWPPSLDGARIVYGIFLVAAVLGLVGLFTRIATVCAALTGAWLLGLPQLSGQVLHTHHLVWFLALLAASPCGDALSIDARLRKRPRAEAIEYGLPLRLAWIAIALLFFFTGYWKLRTGGLGWGEGLGRQMDFKALQTGIAPMLRLDHPSLLQIAGLLAIGFELFVGGFLLWGRTRLWAVGAALLFHAGVRLTMGISFSSLWACYLMFLPWARWLELAPLPALPSTRRWIPAAVIGAGLLGLQLLTGFLGEEQSWPVACYPTFRHSPPAEIAWIEADDQLESGARPSLALADLRGPDGQRWWGVGWRVLREPTPEALAAHYRARRGEPAADVRSVDFYRVTPKARSLLWKWSL
jgi:hypothetical protein